MTFIDTNKHLVSLFLQQVKATPDAPALEDLNNTYTYAELDEKITSLARRLRSQGVGREKLVGILLPHSADFIIACLASLRAGGAYLILELAYPPELLNDVIQDAQPTVLITYKSKVTKVNVDVLLIVLDDEKTRSDTHRYKAFSLPTEYDQDVVSFISYSSGTTGRPKGVSNHDRAGVLSYDQRFAVSDQKPGDRIACNTFFIWEMFRPLIRGATTFAVPDEISYDPVGLVELLCSKRISETLMTPTLLASILAQFPDAGSRLPELRVLWVTGEVVTTDLARRAVKALPRVRLLNSYSTSETWDTAVGDMKKILNDSEQSTYCCVGTPLGVNQIYILDESGNRLERGDIGEIFIGGPVLALGYRNLPETTARTFVPDPFSLEQGARMYRSGDLGRILPSGALELTGRIGAMIKLRGYSVVPATVQMSIVSHLAVSDCAVLPYSDGLEQQLVAYYVRDREENSHSRPVVEVDTSGFSPGARRTLFQYLAAYMIPAYWVEVSKLPADPISGKIDKKRLPPVPIRPGSTVLTIGTNRNDNFDIRADTIARIWASTLNIPLSTITPKHNFFDLGGHSLSFAKLSANFATAFGFRVPVAQLVDSPTLHGHLAIILAMRNGSTASIQTDLPATLRADCLLEEEIQPVNIKMCPLEAADVVFLSGATGFLGAFLLRDLLQNTSAVIICLVRFSESTGRHQSGAEAKARIRKSLLEKDLWCDSFMERIEVVVGDLSQKHLGLSSDAFYHLATRIQVIVHAGAAVNLAYPYAALRGTNVVGTREILRLASMSGSTLQHISTNGVLPPSPPSSSGWPEDAKLDMDEVLYKIVDGYGQTKWVAEQLVIEAGRRGVPVKILRAGTISGHSLTGVTNSQDLLTAIIIESIELGYAPEVRGWRAEMTPVDFISEAIIHLCNTEATQTVFHLGDPNPPSTNAIFQKLQQLGYPTQSLDWSEWVALWTEKRASNEYDSSPPVQILRSCRPTIGSLTDLAVLNNSATQLYHIVRPKIDSRILERYARHWFARGWISKPPSCPKTELTGFAHSIQMGPLRGRVALVTGASSGIGAATVAALAKEGAHVSLAARRKKALESIKSSLKSYGVKVLVHQTDVTDAKQVEILVRTTVKELGPIDILVASAGVMYYTFMKNAQRDEWERTVDVNCKGLLHCLSATVPDMLSRGSGHVVAISSDAGRKVFAGLGVYSGSKFFVEATLQSLRLETVGTGLRVTSIQPGNVTTDLIHLSTDKEAIETHGKPSGARILDADDVANAIVYALRQPKDVSINEILIQPRDEPN